MELILRNGDYVPDGLGGFRRAEGNGALLAKALFLLTARRGSFPFLPELGSRLGTLGREKKSRRETAALQYAQEALEGLEGLTVQSVRLTEEPGGGASAEILLGTEEGQETAEVRIG